MSEDKQLIAEKQIFIGCDVSKYTLDFAIYQRGMDYRKFKHHQVCNDEAGFKELLKWLMGKGVHNIKLKPSAAGKHLYEKFGFGDSGEMELWI